MTGIGTYMGNHIDNYMDACLKNHTCNARPEFDHPGYFDTFAVSYVVIVSGLAPIIIPFIGCCAAFCDNDYMEAYSAGVASILFIPQTIALTLIFIYKNWAGKIIHEFDCEIGDENEEVIRFVDYTATVLAGIGFGITAIQLIFIIVACMLQFRVLQNSKGEKNYYRDYVCIPMQSICANRYFD